jgi:hypothetical protein
MKDVDSLEFSRPEKGNKTSHQHVKQYKKEDSAAAKERLMNIPLITTLSVIALSLLTFITNRILKAFTQQPILLEQRKIYFKRYS